VTWGEWLALWGGSCAFTALVVGWVFLCTTVFSEVVAGVLGVGVPIGLIIGVGGVYLVKPWP
jgi:hypothetical protein